MPGTPYSRHHLLGIFDRAVANGDPGFSLRTARNIDPPIELDRALRLTVALARGQHPSYVLAARRFVARYAEEAEAVSLRNVAQVADALAVLYVVSEASAREREEAERGMLRLATSSNCAGRNRAAGAPDPVRGCGEVRCAPDYSIARSAIVKTPAVLLCETSRYVLRQFQTSFARVTLRFGQTSKFLFYYL